MPANKNAVVRYKYLDDLLSDKYHLYDIHDLTEKVNERLERDCFLPVVQRTIEKDIEFLSYSPFFAPIEHIQISGRSIIRYDKIGYSIFTKELSDEESALLAEVLNTLGQFEGLVNFTWLDGLKNLVGAREQSTVIAFSSNPMTDSNLLGVLFSAISNKQVISLTYHKYGQDSKTIKVHPYLLKQYNNRWFLICAADRDDFILTFSLDRIDKVIECPEKKYRQCSIDLKQRFKYVVGVTVSADSSIEDILIWCSDKGYNHIKSKPLHESQEFLTYEQEESLRNAYPNLGGGKFFRLQCVINTELIRLIMSYMDELVVLSPMALKEQIIDKIVGLNKNYYT